MTNSVAHLQIWLEQTGITFILQPLDVVGYYGTTFARLRMESTISAIPHFTLKEQPLNLCLSAVEHRHRHTVLLLLQYEGSL